MILELVLRAYQRLVVPRLDRAYANIVLRRAGMVGRDVRINGRITVHYPAGLRVGDHVRIGDGCFFYCKGGLEIGANTQISRRVVIYTGNHNVNGEAIPYDDTYEFRPVSIGESVWIGMNVAITPGVTIGDGAIIGLGTVVSKDVPPGAVVVGAPQRIVNTRDMAEFRRLQAEGRLFGALWPDK